jgi:hypothetical protein
MLTYAERREARKDRLKARAAKLQAEAERRIAKSREMASSIPFGQPILVGHHSEGRDRRYRAKIESGFRKGYDTLAKASEVERRASAIGTGGISSDDPEAVTKLKAELAALEQRQEAMKAANAAWRKAGNKIGRQADGSWRDGPHPDYEITNNGANIRRIKQRIEHLGRLAVREAQDVTVGDVRIVENKDLNRLQVFFPGKPADDIRRLLKSYGFRWSPSEGAWQRQISNAALHWAKHIARKVNEGGPMHP